MKTRHEGDVKSSLSVFVRTNYVFKKLTGLAPRFLCLFHSLEPFIHSVHFRLFDDTQIAAGECLKMHVLNEGFIVQFNELLLGIAKIGGAKVTIVGIVQTSDEIANSDKVCVH